MVIKDIPGDEVNEKGNYLRRGTRPGFADIEVIALSLTAECLSIDSARDKTSLEITWLR